MKISKTAIICFCGLMFFSNVAQMAAADSSLDKVKKETAESAQAISEYSVEQRDEAIKKAQAVIREIDNDINSLETRLNEKWAKMDQASRKNSEASLNELREKRKVVNEWYGSLQNSSASTWENVKKGFAESCRKVRDTFSKTEKE